MKNSKATTNSTAKNLQIDVTRLWLVSLKQYNK